MAERPGSMSMITAEVAVLHSGRVTLEQHRLPDRSPGEIDVAITSAAICGSDLHTVLGHRSTPERTALGHEGVGRVVDVDAGATDLRGDPLQRGDRLAFALFRCCGSCDRCAAGLPMKCRSLLKYGHESVTTPPHATGTLASHVRLLPGVPVLRLPDDVDDALVVSAGCAVATAAAVVAAVGTSTSALIFGAGAVGFYCAAMLLTQGVKVQVVDPSAARLALVRRLGAVDRVPGETYPVVIEASGSGSAVVEALQAAEIGGQVVYAGAVSPGSVVAEIDPAVIVTGRLTVNGIHNYRPTEFGQGVDWLLEHGRDLEVDRLVSPPVSLRAIDDAVELMRRGEYARVLVHPESS